MADPQGERLQKALAHAGVGSRRAVEELIDQGRIHVNGRTAHLGQRIDISNDKVEVDGSPVPLGPELVYYLMNKPSGVVTTASDPQGRPTVVDLLDVPARVWPVGRLDIYSEGALILTNDGDLTLRLTHPRYAVPKTYVVEVTGEPSRAALRTLARGVQLDDGVTAPAEVRVLGRSGRGALIELRLVEGRNREIRRMFEAVGYPVARLARTAIGPLGLGHLKPGGVRRLGPAESQALYRASVAGGAQGARR